MKELKRSWPNVDDAWVIEMEIGCFHHSQWNYKRDIFLVDTGYSDFISLRWDSWLELGCFQAALPDVTVRIAGGIVKKKRALVRMRILELNETQKVVAASRKGQTHNAVGRRFLRKFHERILGNSHFTLVRII